MNIYTLLPVLSQAVLAFVFLVLFTWYVKWWKTLSGCMAAGLTACLFTITFTLTLTGSNEGLSASPLAVTIGRIGFSFVLSLGICALQFRRRQLKIDKKIEKEEMRNS